MENMEYTHAPDMANTIKGKELPRVLLYSKTLFYYSPNVKLFMSTKYKERKRSYISQLPGQAPVKKALHEIVFP